MNGASGNILVVDDNIRNLELITRLLRDEGYQLSLAMNGMSAVSQLKSFIPDLIILDIMMPGMDGIELCKKIKADSRISGIPVIFLTAKDTIEDLAEAFNAGGIDYISKPFRREELLLRVKTQVELSRARTEIMELNSSRDYFYSVIAHDIRSPLSDLGTIVRTVDEGILKYDDPDFKIIMGHMARQLDDTLLLLENLLTYTRPGKNQLSFTPENASIGSIIGKSLEMIGGHAQRKNISIIVNVPGDIVAYIDPASIISVFNNAIMNAIKFTNENGSISLTAENSGNFTVVSVTDTGVGISQEAMAKVFEDDDFFSTPGTKAERGSGLGTFIIRDFIKANHGRLEVKSSVGEGTELRIFLPAGN